ncbi:MAG TPA: cupin domain-containing protein [Caulobacteraceae bacterium]|nr:cupin domain-containing protein [Caulobacteraceae bacterium]
MTEAPAPSVRRIVTGVDANGRSHIVGDERLELAQTPPMGSVVTLWGMDEVISLPNDGARPAAEGWMPRPHGARLIVWTKEVTPSTPPVGAQGEAVAAAEVTELYKKGGMHRTETIDWVMLVSGRVSCEMDSGDIVEMSPGDVLIQNGTEHRWKNIGDTRAMLIAAVHGAYPNPETSS